MRLDIPVKCNKSLYEKTLAKISSLPDKNIFIKSSSTDYELISVMADGEALKKVIDIVLKSGIAE